MSLFLRILLAAQGGQYFFGDEGRFERSENLYRALTTGDFAAVRALAAQPEHSLFTALGALVVAGQHLLAQFTPFGDWSHPENIVFTNWLAAVILSLFSTLVLFWIHRLARITGSGDDEALWALLLAASATTLFYPARHLLPYCAALSAALAALHCGLGGPSRARALRCGMLAGITFHLYNGYWYLPPVIMLGYGWWWRNEQAGWPRLIVLSGGAALGVGLPLIVGTLCSGRSYWSVFFSFSNSATQGLFAEGWSLPWEFLWHAEGIFGVAIVLAIILAIVRWRQSVPARVKLWLIILPLSYGLLTLFSTGLERIVIYARTILPFTPLLCLPGGWALNQLVAARPWRRGVITVGIGCATFLHFRPHFQFVFPRDVEIVTLRHYGNPKHTLSVSGSLYAPLALPVTRPDLMLVNAQLLYPVRNHIGYPAGKQLMRIEHPLRYLPFQYESHSPRERMVLRTHDIAMALIALRDPNLPDDLPPPHRFQPSDRSTGR